MALKEKTYGRDCGRNFGRTVEYVAFIWRLELRLAQRKFSQLAQAGTTMSVRVLSPHTRAKNVDTR